MSCAEVLEHDQPLQAFSAGLLNFYNHYCKDLHDSVWCQFHSKTNDDGSRYTTKSPLLCPVQSEAFKELLKSMADKPQEQGCQEGGQGGHLAPGPSFTGVPSLYFRRNSRNMASFCTSDPAN